MQNSNKKTTTLIAALAIVATSISGFVLLKPSGNGFPSVSLFGSCSTDNIAGASKVESTWVTQIGTDLIIQGWVADAQKKTVASEASVQLIDSLNNVIGTWVSKYDTDRPDVAAALDNPALTRSGMNINIGPIALSGLYKIQLGSVNEGQYQVCTYPISIQANE
jgi:hypothetical protein